MKIQDPRESIAGTAVRFAIILSLLFACTGKSDVGGTKPPPRNGRLLRVLFIGNSLTSANDLPLLVQALAKAAGKSLSVESVVLGGANLEDHWNDGAAQQAIARQPWDVVVMQQGPSSLPDSRVHIRKWTAQFAPLIRQAGARPALYMVWPEKDRIAFFDDVRDSYSLAASDVQGMFFPAGEVWRAAWRRDPRAPLYDSDDFHPSLAGSYAAALSIYGVLFRQAPQGLPARLALSNGRVVEVSQALAKLLQDAATEANLTYGRQGNVGARDTGPWVVP